MKLLSVILLLLCVGLSLSQLDPTVCIGRQADLTRVCESSQQCTKYYQSTFYPNNVTTNQQQATIGIELYSVLVEQDCSELSELLVCLALSPECTDSGYRMPCVDLCKAVEGGCHNDIQRLGLVDIGCLLNCDRYPTTECVGLDDPLVTDIVGYTIPTPQATDPLITLSPNRGNLSDCPAEKFYTDSAKSFALGWIAFWSLVCFFSTTLTIATFLIDTSRFPYPWRPVVYLALSFNLHSLTHFLSMIIGRSTVTCPGGEFVQPSITWTWGHTPCILVFGLLYFTMMTAFLWWLILSFSWFLASAVSWSSEAVAHLAPFYHVIAWILPLLMTIVLVATRVVGADELTGICFIVRDDSNMSFLALLLGVIVPLVICLLTGIVFLIIGFISILKIRAVMRSRGKSAESSILEKLVVRIGVFVVIFILPACIVIGCFVYELVSQPHWTPIDVTCTDCARANPAVVMARFFMFLMTGIFTGVWIWSKKTVSSWKMCPQKFIACCKMPQEEEIPNAMNAYENGGNIYSVGDMDEEIDKL